MTFESNSQEKLDEMVLDIVKNYFLFEKVSDAEYVLTKSLEIIKENAYYTNRKDEINHQ